MCVIPCDRDGRGLEWIKQGYFYEDRTRGVRKCLPIFWYSLNQVGGEEVD